MVEMKIMYDLKVMRCLVSDYLYLCKNVYRVRNPCIFHW